MDSFESLIAMLLKRQGYWTSIGVKVDLSKDKKREMGVACTPRPELDVVAYRGATNELLIVECKSFLDSRGVIFRNGGFEPPKRYKLFSNELTRKIISEELTTQLVSCGACAPNPQVIFCLAAGKIAKKTDREQMQMVFDQNGWQLWDEKWIQKGLHDTACSKFENDVAHIVAKLLLRKDKAEILDSL